MTRKQPGPRFVLAVPFRTTYYNAYARALSEAGLLRFYALGTRRGIPEVPDSRTRLNPWIGLAAYIGSRTLNEFQGESFRFRLLPWFDLWIKRQLQPGDILISSYGYANASFRHVHANGGRTFVEAGNSHIENFWEVLTEEQRRWGCDYPPVARHWYERSKAMLAGSIDYVLSPSNFVTQSFLQRGFRPDQIILSRFPVDLSVFHPADTLRPGEKPLTVINTGSLSLRKGTPYLLEAFKLVLTRYPSARLMLTRSIRNDVEPILNRYRDLPIDWSPNLPHAQLAARLQSADVFVLPSLEEGLVRTALEAMACGLPVVLTPNTGANDFVQPGVNGEIVPIRDPAATAAAIIQCWERVRNGNPISNRSFLEQLSYQHFARALVENLDRLGLIGKQN